MLFCERIRAIRAEEVCRELRWQISNNRWDGAELCNRLALWLRVAGKDKYDRPEPLNHRSSETNIEE